SGTDHRSPYHIARRSCPTLRALCHGESRLCGQVSVNLNMILSGDEIGFKLNTRISNFQAFQAVKCGEVELIKGLCANLPRLCRARIALRFRPGKLTTTADCLHVGRAAADG